jgi:hypothetical protein
MSYVTEGDKTWWLPDVLPEPTDEWNYSQRQKRYLCLRERTTKAHPRWYFDNGALVSDEYLYRNELCYLIIDNYPSAGFREVVITDPFEKWILNDEEMTATVTYTIWKYIYPEPSVEYVQVWEWEPEEGNWIRDEENKTITATYSVRDLTPEELSAKDEECWKELRYGRNLRLSATDYIIILAAEKNLQISDQIKEYRQSLRDLPSKVANIRTFDIINDPLWPIEVNSNNYWV